MTDKTGDKDKTGGQDRTYILKDMSVCPSSMWQIFVS